MRIPFFADDVSLYSVASSLHEAVSEVTLAVSSVGCNLAERGLQINFKKSCAMVLGKGSSADSFDGIKYDHDFYYTSCSLHDCYLASWLISAYLGTSMLTTLWEKWDARSAHFTVLVAC